jgi:putative hydrolase of the HAD superfamily
MTRAVLLDMFGTLVELQPPGPRLRARLSALTGTDVGEEAADRGFAAEMRHYLANHTQGRDAPTLESLRDDCAEVLHEALGFPEVERADVRRAMLEALDFRVFPDVAPALERLRGRGLRLLVVSNWDCSLPEWLERAGIAGLVDGAVASATVGIAKPSPAIFMVALDALGVAPGEAVHVGDSVESDVEGARAAGIRPVLIVRYGDGPRGVELIRSLAELPSLL